VSNEFKILCSVRLQWHFRNKSKQEIEFADWKTIPKLGRNLKGKMFERFMLLRYGQIPYQPDVTIAEPVVPEKRHKQRNDPSDKLLVSTLAGKDFFNYALLNNPVADILAR
jgi:hypothetical protein